MARPAQAREGVFVSYARKDGEAFANALRARLEAEHIKVWQDRREIEGGIGWQKQIEEALERVEFLVIVMTPHAMQSEVTRWEWRYARQQGVCVYPVKGVPDDQLDYDGLPRWMRKANFYDLDKEWEKFRAHLNRGCEIARVPFMAPPLTPGFVPRPKEFGELLGLLLDKERKDPVAITTALTGAGGFGKTTLATALCHDDDVIAAFDDGILWVTLGQTPNVVGELTRLYGALSGERPGFVSAEDAAVELQQKLATRNCLIVIDDVWDASHLRPFLRGGPGCARLITTRMRSVAADAKRVDVDEMTGDEAVTLLTAKLEPKPRNLAPHAQLAKRLGEWPLLLKLVGSALHEAMETGDTLEGALKFVNDALDEGGIAVFDRDSTEDRNQAVGIAVGASLKLLAPDERERCLQLGVFPEDAEIPVSVIAGLWGFNSVRTRQLLQKLYGFSLIELDLGAGQVQLHDALAAFFLAQLPDPQEAHRKLVASWGNAHELAEIYAWRWIAYHLVNAGLHDQLRRLLLDLSWLDAKLRATDIGFLLVDFDCLNDEQPLSLLRDTLRLSAHVLTRDKTQLAGQLYGRIPETELDLRERLHAWASGLKFSWLRPLRPTLDAPGGPLIRTLEGHTGAVFAVAITPDGERAISAASDRTLKVWDLATGATLRTLEGHTGPVLAVATTPDGQRVVSAADDRTLKVWDLATGAMLGTFEWHTGPVTAVVVTPDGQRAVSSSLDATLRVWDLATGATLCTVAGHNIANCALAITPDGRRAVSAAAYNTLKLWDLETGATLRILKQDAVLVFAAAIAHDGRRAVSAASDGTLTVWDLETGSALRTLERHTDAVYAVAITPDGRRAISGASDRTLKVWDLETGALLSTLEGHTNWVKAVALTPDGKHIVSAAHDHTLKVWDLMTGHAGRTRERHTGGVRAVAITLDGQRAVSVADDLKVKLWDLATGTPRPSLDDHADSASASVFKLYGQTDRIIALAITPDGRRAVCAAADRTLKVWDLATGAMLRALEGHAEPVLGVAITPDGQRAVSGAGDGLLKVWDLATGVTLRTLEGPVGRVYGVAITADGERAVCAAEDRALKVWDLASGRPLCKLEGHLDTVFGVAITPDGQHTSSAGVDHTLRVWNVATEEEAATFWADAPLVACAIAGDGVTILAGDTTGGVHFLRWENAAPRNTQAPRNTH